MQRDAGCTPEELELLATESKDSFLSVLADVDGVQRVDATTMIRTLMSSVFTMAHRSETIWAINSKVGVRMVNQTHAKQALQSFMHFHNYPTKDLIAVMSDASISYQTTLQEVGRFLKDLGVVNINEPAFTHIVAIWMGYEVKALGDAYMLDAHGANQRPCDLKTVLHTERRRFKLPHFGAVC